MNWLISPGSILVLATLAICRAETVNFDHATAGSVPEGWTIAMTHAGGAPKWEVRGDDSAPSKPNVFAQVSTDHTAGRFPLAIWDRVRIRDGVIKVRFKAISGSVDQGAGLVWRYKDANNYYIVRANALEDNVVLYKVQNGERVALAPKDAVSNSYGVKHRVPRQTWTALSVNFQGNIFRVSLDGEELFAVEDSTFSGAGKTGLWTKADSVIYFDDFQIKETLMKTHAALIFTTAVMAGAQTVNFDNLTIGAPPPGWTATQTGKGEAKWTIEKDDTAPSKPNVLKQSGQAAYPVCIKDDTNVQDGFVEVKFKPISGKEDQAGGVIWRAKDSNNYYVARANALEGNVTIYDTVAGRRTERKRTKMKVATNQWHTLRVDFQGKHFTVTLDGTKAIDWDDEKFKDAGKVGVWTKADSVTLFDDFTYGAKQ